MQSQADQKNSTIISDMITLMDTSGSFEDHYKENKSYWGEKPSLVILDNLSLLNPGTVLDVGAGDGRNSVFLADQGFKVAALDVSPTGLKNIEEKAAAKGLLVETIAGDIRELQIAGEYDNIISNFTLHFLGPEQIMPTLHKMAAATKPGGINIVDDFTPNGPLVKDDPEFYPTEDSLVNFYSSLGWEILFKNLRQVETKVHETPGQPLTHEAIAIIAKKP